MKETFQALYYKVPAMSCGNTANFGSETLLGDLPDIQYVDHPADKIIDYNSIIDFLEEEH
jgi:hypothetical protein